MRPFSSLLSLSLFILSLLLVFANPVLSQTGTQQVQWGYSLSCPNNTLDYPCLTQLTGTAIINSTLMTASYGGQSYQYYQLLSFTGTRTFYNRYGQQYSTSATLASLGELNGKNQLVLSASAIGIGTPTFRLGSLIQFPGGLFGNEVQLIVAAGGYPVESITINATATNSLNSDPSLISICSTAPSFQSSSYNPNTEAPSFSNTMAQCQQSPSFTIQSYSSSWTSPGLRTFIFTYSITDGLSFAAQVNATISTDGTVNMDQLGNIYYNVIAITGTRYEQSLVSVSASTTVSISSLMAPNIIATSNLAYITNNNRIYPQYPYLDRYGLAYTVTSRIGSVTEPELVDGTLNQYTNTVGVYIYRLDTLDEQGLGGNFAYPPFNANNSRSQSLTLTQIPNPSTNQLVFFCYVMYGLPNTLDYPWSVVTSGTSLINNSLTSVAVNSYGLTGTLPSYHLLGFVGTRTYTNRYGARLASALTFDALGEDANVGYLVPVSPYAPQNSVSFHVNSTIQTAGGLPATDISFFLDPYPIEGTAYGYGVGTGTNALNCDPSRTLFVSNMPGFTNGSYSNTNTATLAGNVMGTSDLSQCKSVMPSPLPVDPSIVATGLRIYNLIYNLTGTAGYNSYGNLQLITDGTVGQDQLGNYYYPVVAIGGYRLYRAPNGTLLDNVTVTALLPICSGPSVSNFDSVYCNNNRLYPQFPFVDRLGLAYQVSSLIPVDGSLSPTLNSVGLLVYRHTILEEAHAGSGGNQAFTDTPTGASITLSSPLSNTANYQVIQWGYIMYCIVSALEYPCAVSVQGTLIIAGTSPIISVCDPTSEYGPLCSQPAYVIQGFVGTRTFTNKYGEISISYLSSQPVGEDFADDLVYLVAPYVDSDGPTFRLNGTDGSLTEVIGGSMTNEINVFINPNPTEGIAVSGSDPSALIYNASLTVFCSTMQGFVGGVYNAASQYPAGSTNMAQCLPNRNIMGPKQTSPSFNPSITGVSYTLAYSISDGASFTVQTFVTVTSDGNAYIDTLGNRYILVVSANGTRTYYDWTSATSTPITNVINGVAPVNNFTMSSDSLTGNKNTNRLYPFATPYLDVLGIAFTMATPAPYTGAVQSTTNIINVFSHKEQTVEEYQRGGKYPNAKYQTLILVSGTAIPILPTPTQPASRLSSSSSTASPISSFSSSSSSTTANSNSNNSNNSSNSLSGGDIAGIVVGTVAGATIIFVACLLLLFMNRRKETSNVQSKRQLNQTQKHAQLSEESASNAPASIELQETA